MESRILKYRQCWPLRNRSHGTVHAQGKMMKMKIVTFWGISYLTKICQICYGCKKAVLGQLPPCPFSLPGYVSASCKTISGAIKFQICVFIASQSEFFSHLFCSKIIILYKCHIILHIMKNAILQWWCRILWEVIEPNMGWSEACKRKGQE